jgi:hypothetical protein
MKILFLILMMVFEVNAWSIEIDRLDSEKIIPAYLLKKAIDYFNTHQNQIHNKRYVGIIDFKQHNSKERFYLLDLEGNTVETYLVAHGKNTDQDFDGYADSFSNTVDSLQSSLGFYVTGETYIGENGYSLRLDGLSSTNSNARLRNIVMHGADYVKPGTKIGRSFGCPAVETRYSFDIIEKIKNGSLLFAAFEN